MNYHSYCGLTEPYTKATEETSYSIAFGTEAVVPVEIGMPSYRVQYFQPEQNLEQLNLSPEQQYTNKGQLHTSIQGEANKLWVGNLVLIKIFQSTKEQNTGVLGPKWEGPYRVVEIVRPGTYRLEDMNGVMLPHPWNVEHLRIYYQ